MAKRRQARKRARPVSRRRNPVRGRGDTPQLNRAKQIVRTMTGRGMVRSATVLAAVRRAGISTRTYRTARKQLGTRALRSSSKRRTRGSGRWYAKSPGR